MYAAGHPPLPSIDIVTFCDQMPAHWRYLSQKPPAVQRDIRAAFHIPKDEKERTKLTALSAVVTFQACMELLGDTAVAAAKEDRADQWPELANYDCYACHHELKTPSWRQKRGYAGRPGRPPMQGWPTVLLEDALRLANDPILAKQYDERLRKLRQAFDARPFGEAKEIAERAGQLKDWSQRLLPRLKEVRYDPAAARGMCGQECGYVRLRFGASKSLGHRCDSDGNGTERSRQAKARRAAPDAEARSAVRHEKADCPRITGELAHAQRIRSGPIQSGVGKAVSAAAARVSQRKVRSHKRLACELVSSPQETTLWPAGSLSFLFLLRFLRIP
jgi:hypothetical protein